MNILPSEMPKNARGRPLKGGWPVHAKGLHDVPNDVANDHKRRCHKRRCRKNLTKCSKVTAFAGAARFGEGHAADKSQAGWMDPSTWLADAWREDHESED